MNSQGRQQYRREVALTGTGYGTAPPTTVSASSPDWSRERKAFFAWDPPRSLLASIRAYQRHKLKPLRALAVFRYRFWSAITGADIKIKTRIAGGLSLPHPVGVVIHNEAVIGPNCLIQSGVVIGVNDRGGVPTLGGHVDVGSGAKLLGGITIGSHAKIGANAVVLRDVPAGATAVGVPARIITERGRS
jgi:serine O-acetyltransferase